MGKRGTAGINAIAVLLAAATAAAAAPPPGDLNGDGTSDLVVGVPFEDLPGGGSSEAQGAVDVIDGGDLGLTLPSPPGNGFTQDTTGLDGDGAENGDHFGSAVASGDFNGDGIADLVAGAPGETLRSDGSPGVNEGAVNVIYGSDAGLTPARDRFITQDTLGIASDGAESGDQFGQALTTGDFNGDGRDDVAVGSPTEDLASADDHLEGAVNVIYGSKRGLTPKGNRFFTQDTKGMAGDGAEFAQEFGSALATGDVDGDGRDELAVGAPGQFANSLEGEVNILYGSPKGLITRRSQILSQDTKGIADQAEAGDGFAAAVELADLNGDGRDDLAVGVPYEDVTPIGGGADIHDAGIVHLIYGGDNRLEAKGDALVSQDRPDGIAGDGSEAEDRFGASLAAGRFWPGEFEDLAIGVPQESVFTTSSQSLAGAAIVLRGRAEHGFAAPGDFFTEDAFATSDGPETSDQFGEALSAARFNGDGRSDLAIGISHEDGGAGAVGVLFGGPDGLDSGQFLDQADAGLGNVEPTDFFGAALAP